MTAHLSIYYGGRFVEDTRPLQDILTSESWRIGRFIREHDPDWTRAEGRCVYVDRKRWNAYVMEYAASGPQRESPLIVNFGQRLAINPTHKTVCPTERTFGRSIEQPARYFFDGTHKEFMHALCEEGYSILS